MRSLASLGLVLAGCLARPSEPSEPAPAPLPIPPPPPALASPGEPACVPEGGDAARCCPSRLGFDPGLVRERCGWSSYLGERAELACVHAFTDATGERVEVFVTPLVGLDLAHALAIHMAGLTSVGAAEPERWTAGEQGGELVVSEHEGFAWAFVPGWPALRRVGWARASCSDEAMLALLRTMSDAPPQRAGERPLPDMPIDLDAPVALTGLLADRSARASDATALVLPEAAPRFADALLELAARDELDGYLALLAPAARWGLPDRRQLGGRPIAGSTSEARTSFVALRRAAARLPTTTKLACPQPSRRARQALQRGEQLQWCFWISDDGLDVLALGLRSVDGFARLDYLGVFPEPPGEPVFTRGEPPPPPSTPPVPIDCDDPHTRDPDVCAPPEPVDPALDPAAYENQRPASTMR